MKFKSFAIEEIAEINADQYSSGEKWLHIQYLDTGSVSKGRIVSSQQLDSCKDTIPGRARRKVKNQSIVYSMVRPNQEHYALLTNPAPNTLVSTGFCVIDADERYASPGYLFYLLTTQRTINHFQALAEQSASTYPTLGLSDLAGFQVNLPSVEIQKRVESIISPIDRKIELNNRVNDYLYELCRAKLANMLKAGESGKTTIGNYCKKLYSGGTPSTSRPDYWDGRLPWLSSGETRQRFIIETKKNITEEGVSNSSTKLARRGDVVVASAGQGLTRGQTSVVFLDVFVNQSILVLSPKTHCGAFLLLYLANSYEALRAWSDSASTRGSISGKLLRQFEAPYLEGERLEELDSFCRPLFAQIEFGLHENLRLSELRDALLPKLVSGAIDISEINLRKKER